LSFDSQNHIFGQSSLQNFPKETMNLIADELKLNKDAIAQLLINKISELGLDNVIVYYNFPFYRGESKDDLVQAHVLFISKDYGVLFFRCIDQINSFTDIEKAKLDDLDSHIFSKINKHEVFRLKRRELKINVSPYVFVRKEINSTNESFIGVENIKDVIHKNIKEKLNEEEYELLISIIEGTVNLKLKKDRPLEDISTLTKGKVLSIIQNKEAVFDIEQKRAALNIIDSPQRIRGLAGSGKTIILTMKAALYHLQNPEAEILYTYFTKALYGQVKYLIEKYYRDFSENREPDWKKIHIWHGWGGKGLQGVYSDTCFENGIEPISFFTAKRNNPKDPFSYVCESLERNNLKEKFDLTLIDEGQDFPSHFYRLCRKITKDNRIVWAYDDFQNIFDVDIQNEKETFGRNKEGRYYVDFSREENKLQDIVLYKCYRNPRFALLSAFALGLGIYNDKVLQRLENNKHWEDLGFEIEKGDSKDFDEMIISRPPENSPIETNEYFNEESIQIKVFNDIQSESKFIVDEIEKDIKEHRLRPDDICVISLDGKSIAEYFEAIELNLLKRGIKVFNLLNAPNNNTFFSVENHVTLSTINKAKGNETGMVYIVGIDAVFNHKDYVIDRNKLFTAITRSKGWVTLTGAASAKLCEVEMNKLKANYYKLVFKQPSKDATKTILRGMTQQQGFLNELNKKIEVFSKNSGLSRDEIIRIITDQMKNKK
jgi:superfamily I DNA and RNA helicase